jgi:peptide/nickel transport system permease protein
MFAYTVRRILMTIPVMLVVALFVYALLELAPGDPAVFLAGDDATAEDIERIRSTLGLDRPFIERFVLWLFQIARGDLGVSLFTGVPVAQMIVQRIPSTFTLMLMTLVVSVLVAIPVGALAAWYHNRLEDRLVMVGAVFSFSLPTFVLPVQGYVPLSDGFWASLRTLILPTLALASVYVALITRITRATLLETLSQDYIRTARAKGVDSRNVLFRHALRNAAVPIVTVIGSGVALLISGAVVTETVFSIPGLGRLTVDAILRRDYPIIQGVILLFSLLYVLINLIVDLLYRVFDPRITY